MLKQIIVDGRYQLDRAALRAASWFNLGHGGLSEGQERRLKSRRSRRYVARQMLMRQSEGTIWFTDGAMPRIPQRPTHHRLLLMNVNQSLAEQAVGKWIQAHGIQSLHVTGIEGRSSFIFAFLCRVFLSLGFSFRTAGRRTLEPGCILLMDGANAQAISPWPGIQVYRKSRRWRLDTNSVFAEAMHSLRFHENVPHVKQFLDQIPEPARMALLNFPDSHRRFLRLFKAFERPITDLARGGAWMVIYMLCHMDAFPVFTTLDRHDREDLLSQKQRLIWSSFGLPDSESIARLMRRIPAECCSLAMFHSVRRVLMSDTALAHIRPLPRINLGAVRVAPHRLATAELVREVAGNQLEDRADAHGLTPTARLLDDIMEEAAHRRAMHLVRPIRTVAAAHRLMQAILDVAVPGQARIYRQSIPLNPPSIPGFIEQITDSADLQAEGRVMGHCVASYRNRMLSRMSLIFRVLPDRSRGIERSTLELVPGVPPRLWDPGQLKGVRNQSVSSDTNMLIATWLETVNANPRLP